MLEGIDPKPSEWQQTGNSRSTFDQLPYYVYRPLLQGQDTRVLHLQPWRDGQDDIVCRIEHVSISGGTTPAAGTYEALSYVCGPDDPSCLIKHIDGGLSSKLSVRPYLFDAIKGLGPSTTERVFWIDQISIDQSNLQERADQVRKFSLIFTRASSVIIWIREPEWSTVGTAFRFVDFIAKQLEEAGLHLIEATHDTFLDKLIDLPPQNDPRCLELRTFLQNQWFFRAWTFQECILARGARFVCGPHSLTMRAFVTTAAILYAFPETEKSENYRFGDGRLVLSRIAFTLTAVVRAQQNRTSDESQTAGSLFYLLSSLRSLKCFDVRDKIWAIIGIANDYDEDAVPVDYESSWQSLYTRVCHWAHDRYQDLSFLQLTEIRTRDMDGGVDKNRPQGLPSWAPLFQAESLSLNLLYQPKIKQRQQLANKIYYASGSSRSAPQTRLLDEEAALATSQTQGPALEPKFSTGENGKNLPDLLSENPNFSETNPGSGDFFIDGDLEKIGGAILAATTRRRMFITDTGYMGLTHRSNLVGDEIWVLMGADMPVTLHPTSDADSGSLANVAEIDRMKRFGFRGESYVHGTMDGEALISARKQEDVDCPLGNEWLDDLGAGPFPFTVEKVILV